jgi:hypothetical protein
MKGGVVMKELTLVRRRHIDLLRIASAACRRCG